MMSYDLFGSVTHTIS